MLYDLHIDLRMYFCPPMNDRGRGITLTRRIQLPFPPFNGLSLTGSTIDVVPMPEGFTLNSVVWDCDRSRFTAYTEMSQHDFPIASIPDELNAWIDRGWRLGSSADVFDDAHDSGGGDEEVETTDSPRDDFEPADEEDAWPMLPPRKRPKEFNKLFRALIRLMCEAHNAESRAYAMWRTQRFYSDEELKKSESSVARRFKDAESEFYEMTIDEQIEWRKRICRNYPRLDRILAKA
ncbi:MAG: hypothetical protein CMJ58_28135 [Planctomycetaceae bacterium]|nr:hypothetical protein [Planctomycetaceae bacterium]